MDKQPMHIQPSGHLDSLKLGWHHTMLKKKACHYRQSLKEDLLVNMDEVFGEIFRVLQEQKATTVKLSPCAQ